MVIGVALPQVVRSQSDQNRMDAFYHIHRGKSKGRSKRTCCEIMHSKSFLNYNCVCLVLLCPEGQQEYRHEPQQQEEGHVPRGHGAQRSRAGERCR